MAEDSIAATTEPTAAWRKVLSPANWVEVLRAMDNRGRQLYLKPIIEEQIRLREQGRANAATVPEQAQKMQSTIEQFLPNGIHEFVRLAVEMEAAMAAAEGRKMEYSNVFRGIGNAINLSARGHK